MVKVLNLASENTPLTEFTLSIAIDKEFNSKREQELNETGLQMPI
jgi:hypothetical protein